MNYVEKISEASVIILLQFYHYFMIIGKEINNKNIFSYPKENL